MSELNVMALALTLRAITIITITAGVVYLAANEKPGWGWLMGLEPTTTGITTRLTNPYSMRV